MELYSTLSCRACPPNQILNYSTINVIRVVHYIYPTAVDQIASMSSLRVQIFSLVFVLLVIFLVILLVFLLAIIISCCSGAAR